MSTIMEEIEQSRKDANAAQRGPCITPTHDFTYNLVISGSRSLDDANSFTLMGKMIHQRVVAIGSLRHRMETVGRSARVCIVHGKASRGGDAAAEGIWKFIQGQAGPRDSGVDIRRFPAAWRDRESTTYNARLGYDPLAGHARNAEMALAGHELMCFWDGASTGTKDMWDRFAAQWPKRLRTMYLIHNGVVGSVWQVEDGVERTFTR